jgi:hypothetical protein
MDNAKVDEVLDKVIGGLTVKGHVSRRWPADSLLPTGEAQTAVALAHALWLAMEARTWSAERLEKKFRWLGFIQGILWMTGESTIESAKNANKPAEEK